MLIKKALDKKFILCGIIFLLAMPSVVFAYREVTPQELMQMSLEDLMNVKVITASKQEQSIEEAPSIISVVTAQDIEAMGANSLIDVLKYVPAIETSMEPDGDYRVSIRGIRKDGNILLLIDGEHINNFYDGLAIYDLPVDFIERVEVIRGPGSALFGTDAVAGIINIISVKNDRTFKLKKGTNNFVQGSFNYGAERDELKLSVSAGFLQTDGANNRIKEDRGKSEATAYLWDIPLLENGANTNRWIKDSYVRMMLDYKNSDFSLFAFHRNRGAWVGPVFILSPDCDYQTTQITMSLGYKWQLNKKLLLLPKFYHDINLQNNLIEEAPDGYREVFRDGRLTKEKYTGVNVGSEIQANYDVNDRFHIITGVLLEHLLIAKYDISRNYKVNGMEYKGAFGNYDDMKLVQKDKVRNIFAYYFQSDYQRAKFGITAGFRYDKYTDFGASFNPRLGLTYKPFDLLNFKILYGQAFRAPTFKELYDRTNLGNDGVMGNEDLEPEKVKCFEFGWELKNRYYALGSNFFYNFVDDVISVYDPHGGGGLGDYVNIGSKRNYGFDAEISVQPIRSVRLFINFSSFLTEFEWNKDSDLILENDKRDLNDVDKYMRNMPINRLNCGVDFNYAKLSAFVGCNYGSKSESNRRNVLERIRNVEIDAYLQGAINLTYRIDNTLSLHFSANNLGKDKYSDPDESTNINAFGNKGLIQPSETYVFGVVKRF